MDLDSFASSSAAAPPSYAWIDPTSSSASTSTSHSSSHVSAASSSTTKRSRHAMQQAQHEGGDLDGDDEMVAFKRLRIHRNRSEESDGGFHARMRGGAAPAPAAAPGPATAFPPRHQHQPPRHQLGDQDERRWPQQRQQQHRAPASCPSSPTAVAPAVLQRHSSADVAAGGVVPVGLFPQQQQRQHFHSRTNSFPTSSSFRRQHHPNHLAPPETTATATPHPSAPAPGPRNDEGVDYTPFNRLLGNLHQQRRHRYLSQPPPDAVRFTDRTGLGSCPDGQYIASGASSSMSSISTYGAEEAANAAAAAQSSSASATGYPSHRVIRKILQTDSRLF